MSRNNIQRQINEAKDMLRNGTPLQIEDQEIALNQSEDCKYGRQ